MKKNIVGREKEQELLEKYVKSSQSEFIAIYGRRRVGKTFLVRELFEGHFSFRVTGRENIDLSEQLHNFHQALTTFIPDVVVPSSWEHAFQLLAHYIEQLKNDDPKLLFFDELPWFDTRNSNFVSALEHFWNDWASYRHDVKLIVCGSATTWMLDKIINSRGGLHNRVTHQILLSPFTLHETEEYFKSRGCNYERSELLECYMAVGGVAYYLSLFESDKSVAQNIDWLCFRRGGELVNEFERIFKSLFKKADSYLAIITTLQKKGMGMTRQEIVDATGLINNGNLTRMLNELEVCDFLRSFVPFGKLKKEKLYQLIDPFTLFYFRFMQGRGVFMQGYWQKMQSTNEYDSWCGYAFELVCLNHLEQIVRGLGIDGSINTACSWSYRPSAAVLKNDETDEDLRHGSQIDLLIDRSDKTINVCEMKYRREEYEITKAYDAILARRMRTFRKITKTRKSVIPVFITPFGLFQNAYARRIPRVITVDSLFL